MIERQLTRLDGLVGDVLDATWIEGGELRLLCEQIDLRSITAASVDLFRALAPQHRIELTMPPDPVLVPGDRARLEQVLNNLLSNAVKYSPLGSRVRVDLALRGDEVRLKGIAKAVGTPYAIAKPFPFDHLVALVNRALTEAIPPRPNGSSVPHSRPS